MSDPVRTLIMPPRSPFAGREMPYDSPEFDSSLENPLSVLLPYISIDPDWFIIGGMGDGQEGRLARMHWPDVQMLGIDPDPEVMQIQETRSEWHDGSCLLHKALSMKRGVEKLYTYQLGAATLHEQQHKDLGVTEDQLTEVHTVTIDDLDNVFGPFRNAVLWLDCEGYDHMALHGAYATLLSQGLQVINFEVWYKLEEAHANLERYLENMKYRRTLVWFRQWWGHNELWVRNV